MLLVSFVSKLRTIIIAENINIGELNYRQLRCLQLLLQAILLPAVYIRGNNLMRRRWILAKGHAGSAEPADPTRATDIKVATDELILWTMFLDRRSNDYSV